MTYPAKEAQPPALYTEEAALELSRRTFRCATCEWAVRPAGDECAEQEYVLGCIHWRRRSP